MLIILGSVHGFGLFGSVCLVAEEMICIFVMHLLIANLSKLAHKQSKWLLCAFARNQYRVGNSRGKLQMELQIARLHTTKRLVNFQYLFLLTSFKFNIFNFFCQVMA